MFRFGKKQHREGEYRTTSGSGHNKTMEKHEKTGFGRLKVKRTDKHYGDGIHGRTIERFDEDGNKVDKLYMEGKHDRDGNFHGDTKLEYANHKQRIAYSSKKEIRNGLFTNRAGQLKTAEKEGNLRNAAMEDEQLRRGGANRNYRDLHGSTDEEYERDEREREEERIEEKKQEERNKKFFENRFENDDEFKSGHNKKGHNREHSKKAVQDEINSSRKTEERGEDIEGEGEDIEEEDKPKEHIHTKEKRRKMYHSGAGKQETLVGDKDRYTGKDGGFYRQREEEGEFTHQKPSSDFKHSKFKGTNDHKRSATEFTRREEHVSDTDKRFLNTDKDYKVETKPTHIEGPVTEEKRGTKVRVEKEGSVGDKTLSRFSPTTSKGETHLYDDKTGKHLKKTTFKDRDEYHEIDPSGTKIPISKEDFENEESAFENTPSDLDTSTPAKLTPIPKPTLPTSTPTNTYYNIY
jgi:hypothetical protein